MATSHIIIHCHITMATSHIIIHCHITTATSIIILHCHITMTTSHVIIHCHITMTTSHIIVHCHITTATSHIIVPLSHYHGYIKLHQAQTPLPMPTYHTLHHLHAGSAGWFRLMFLPPLVPEENLYGKH